MKTKVLVSLLVAITAVMLSPSTRAAEHAGGGGGFSGAGGGHFSGGAGARPAGGGFHAAPAIGGAGHFGGGAAFRGGGVGFRSVPPRMGEPQYTARATQLAQPRNNQFRSPVRQLPSVAGQNRANNNASSIARQNRGVNNPATRTAGRAEFNRRVASHVAERHDSNWHRDWDRRHAHFDRDHHRFFVFIDGFWCGLDDGFFPWDYYPYYAYDYNPYDYDYADPGYNDAGYNNTPLVDPTVTAVQTQLTRLGYYTGPVDGIYGPATRDAVAKYQIAQNIEVSGGLSSQTLQSLGVPTAS